MSASANNHVDGAGECVIDAELAADGLAVCSRLEFVCSLEASEGELPADIAYEIRAPLLETFIRLTKTPHGSCNAMCTVYRTKMMVPEDGQEK